VDIRDFKSETRFDIVLAHLLLGEATKFGNRFDEVLNALFSINTDYWVIVDVLEDQEVNYRSILKAVTSKGSVKALKSLNEYIGFLISSAR
jgi:hypothetical protein